MLKMLLVVFLLLITLSLQAETLGFYTAGYRNDGKNHTLRTYLFVDHYQLIATLILDADNNWFIDEDEVTMIPLFLVEGSQGDATYQGRGALIIVDGNKAELIMPDGVEMNLRSTNIVPIK